MIRLTFLGTAAARPTVRRNVTSLAVQREGDHFLFDCGEGTQRQMMRFGTGFAVDHIFFTHMHADHILGLTGLLRTMALQGRSEPLSLYGPTDSEAILRQAVDLGVERVGFPVSIRELQGGDSVGFEEYEIRALDVDHRTPALGFALVEEERLGRFDVEKARSMGVPEGPLFGRLHRGEAIEVDGKIIRPEELVGEPRPGRRVVFSGDTRPCASVLQASEDADVLIHDATFGQEEAERARDTYHSTAAEAAEVAARAGAHALYLTHISARYSEDPRELEREARHIFSEAHVARDGLVVEVPVRNEGEDDE